MNIVCSQCGKSLINGKWVDAIVPISTSRSTVCPDCQSKEKGEHEGFHSHSKRDVAKFKKS